MRTNKIDFKLNKLILNSEKSQKIHKNDRKILKKFLKIPKNEKIHNFQKINPN